MARRVVRLTDKEVENAKPKKKDYRLYDGDGLQLLVRTSGTKVWQYPYNFKGKRSIYTIGEYHKSKPGALGIKDTSIKRIVRDRCILCASTGKITNCNLLRIFAPCGLTYNNFAKLYYRKPFRQNIVFDRMA